MGYNVLSGSVSVTHLTSVSGSFTGDGSGLENVEQFPLQNAGVTKIPFYKTIGGELGLNASDSFTFNVNSNALTIPGLTSSVGIKLANPISGSLASTGSYLGLDANGNIVVTSSVGGISYSRRFVTSSTTASVNDTLIGISASSALELRLAPAQTYTEGQYFIVKDEGGNSNVNNITIKTSGSQTIDGSTSVILESPYAAVNIYSDGVSKFFIY